MGPGEYLGSCLATAPWAAGKRASSSITLPFAVATRSPSKAIALNELAWRPRTRTPLARKNTLERATCHRLKHLPVGSKNATQPAAAIPTGAHSAVGATAFSLSYPICPSFT